MSITKSYNKHTDTYYAYETSYVWDDKRQKKVQKKVCVGHFDPQTGEIIPNAKRGRPGIKEIVRRPQPEGCAEGGADIGKLRLAVLELSADVHQIRVSANELLSSCQILEERISALKMLFPEN